MNKHIQSIESIPLNVADASSGLQRTRYILALVVDVVLASMKTFTTVWSIVVYTWLCQLTSVQIVWKELAGVLCT